MDVQRIFFFFKSIHFSRRCCNIGLSGLSILPSFLHSFLPPFPPLLSLPPPSLPSFSFLFIAHSMPFQYIVSDDFHFRKLFLNFNFQYLFWSTSLVSVFKLEGELLLYICCFFFILPISCIFHFPLNLFYLFISF